MQDYPKEDGSQNQKRNRYHYDQKIYKGESLQYKNKESYVKKRFESPNWYRDNLQRKSNLSMQ